MRWTSLLRIYLTRSFKPFVFEGTHENTLDFEKLDDLGLYVHIPFCRSFVQFSALIAKWVHNKPQADAYKIALLKEIDLVCKGMSGKKQATSLLFRRRDAGHDVGRSEGHHREAETILRSDGRDRRGNSIPATSPKGICRN